MCPTPKTMNATLSYNIMLDEAIFVQKCYIFRVLSLAVSDNLSRSLGDTKCWFQGCICVLTVVVVVSGVVTLLWFINQADQDHSDDRSKLALYIPLWHLMSYFTPLTYRIYHIYNLKQVESRESSLSKHINHYKVNNDRILRK